MSNKVHITEIKKRLHLSDFIQMQILITAKLKGHILRINDIACIEVVLRNPGIYLSQLCDALCDPDERINELPDRMFFNPILGSNQSARNHVKDCILRGYLKKSNKIGKNHVIEVSDMFKHLSVDFSELNALVTQYYFMYKHES